MWGLWCCLGRRLRGGGGGEGFKIWNGRTKEEMGEGFWKVLFCKICEQVSEKRVWVV